MTTISVSTITAGKAIQFKQSKSCIVKPEISLREKLFKRILSDMKFAGTNLHGEAVYYVQWLWKTSKETYYLSLRDIAALVDDIIDEHPRCWEYRRATIALMDIESKLPLNEWVHRDVYLGYKKLDKSDHKIVYIPGIRDVMLNLHINTNVMSSLTTLGENPTQHLHKDVEESKRLASMLINKLWRDKKDFEAKKTVNEIKGKLVDALLADPVKAFQGNSYAYAALKEHSCNWK